MKNMIVSIVGLLIISIMLWSCSDDDSGSNNIEPQNDSPTCNITSPLDFSNFNVGDMIEVKVGADDEDGTINQIRFEFDSLGVGSTDSYPYTYSLLTDTCSERTYIIKVIAEDNDGAETSDEVSVNLTIPANIPPICSIVSPSDSTEYIIGDQIDINVNASDSDGTISEVSFYLNDIEIAIDVASPFQFTLQTDSVEAGTHEIAVIARDDDDDEFESQINIILRDFHLFEELYNELGLLRETNETVADRDFRNKIGKLAFIQFLTQGDVSCLEQAVDFKNMYEDISFDLSKYSHSMFGDFRFTEEADFRSYVSTNALPYDCFWDNLGNTKNLLTSHVGYQVYNDVFAVMPNGTVIKYDLLTDGYFEPWIHSIYELAYPSK